MKLKPAVNESLANCANRARMLSSVCPIESPLSESNRWVIRSTICFEICATCDANRWNFSVCTNVANLSAPLAHGIKKRFESLGHAHL